MTVDLPPPLPVTDDPDTAGFWEAAQRGCIAVLRCAACGNLLHLPTPYCAGCDSWDVAWQDVRPHGRVYSFTVVEQSVHPAFPAPYTIVLVDLDDAPGARLVGHLPGRADVTVGMPMTATFETRDGVSVPQWEPSNAVADP